MAENQKLTEVDRLLGRETATLANQQVENAATNPSVTPRVLEETQRLVTAGYIGPDSPTAKVRGAAIKGDLFQQMERDNNGVCMDDATPEDR